MPSDDLVKLDETYLREMLRDARQRHENGQSFYMVVKADEAIALFTAALAHTEAAARLASPPGDAVEVVAPTSLRALVDSLVTFGRSHDGAVERDLYAEVSRIEARDAPERAHGEQMREAIAAAVQADRKETLRRLDFERLWNCKTGADAKNAIEIVMMDIKCRALPLPPAEERT